MIPKADKRLTKAGLDKLRREAKADSSFSRMVADAGAPGLYVQVRRGRVTFVFVYRPPSGGQRRRLTIDDFGAITLDQAREIAGSLRGDVAAGRDPKAERERVRRESETVAGLVESYLVDLRARAESGAKRGRRSGLATAENRLRRHVLPKLGKLRVRDLTVDHVRRMHRSLKATPVEANRTLTALSAVLGFGSRQGTTPAGFNPARHVERFEETGERRALMAEELRALGDAMREAETSGTVSPVALLALRLIALTGLRRSELLGHESKARRGKREGLRWSDVDLDAGTLSLRQTKTGAQTRVLGSAAVELLREAKPATANPSEPVCPGKIEGQPFVGIDRPRAKLYAAAGIEGADLHSLRHSFASIGAHVQHGRFLGHVAPLLGHGYQKRSITERYITADPAALKQAADAIAGELASLLGLSGGAEVVEFPVAIRQ